MARIAVIGQIVHDTILRLDRIPGPGKRATGSSANLETVGGSAVLAASLARLGESVTLRAVVGNDHAGTRAVEYLRAQGVDCGMVTQGDQPTDRSTILLDERTGKRAIVRHPGAMIRMGDRLDIAGLFDHDIVILDMVDEPLRRFLTDLPAHTRPDVRLLGPIGHIIDTSEPDAIEIAFRFDTIVGTERQYLSLFDIDHVADIPSTIQRHMPGANLRAAVIFGDDHPGCRWVTRDESGTSRAFPVDAILTNGLQDAFVAGIAWSMARRLPWPEAARFAHAVAALSDRSVDANTSLPTLSEVEDLLRS